MNIDKISDTGTFPEDTIAAHFENPAVVEHYGNAFFQESPDYIRWVLDKILHHLALTPTDHLLDLGCGTGSFTHALATEAGLQQAVTGVDPSEAMLQKASERGGIICRQADALWFIRNCTQKYDKILLKEMIHYIKEDDLNDFYAAVYRCLNPGGKVLTVTRPSQLRYPFFEAALAVWRQSQLPAAVYINAQQNAGFQVNCVSYEYPVEMAKSRWFGMIEQRFWSNFSVFSDEAIAEGIGELEKIYADRDMLAFSETLIFIEAVRW